MKKLKVALIHDHLAQDGGAEKVLKIFTEMYPDAPIYTLLFEKHNVSKNFKDKKIMTSIIQRLPGGVRFYQWYMPFMPMAVEFYDLRDYDIVISNASAFAKGVITTPDTLHICYCHTPTRYLWDYTHQYINELGYNRYFKKLISLILNNIRIWDRLAADRVDDFIANSKTVQRRISKYYRRDSRVIYPPVETEKFSVSEKAGDYYLIGGRLVPYKRFDVVVEAFAKNGRKLKVFGSGVDLERLRILAGDKENVEFLGRVSDQEKIELYRGCKAFLNPQEEDFGITMVESLASGRPVIAYRRGGATEIVKEDETGVFFDEQTIDAVTGAVERFEKMDFDAKKLKDYAESYSIERFKGEIQAFIDEKYRAHLKKA